MKILSLYVPSENSSLYAIQQYDMDIGGQDAALLYGNQNEDHVHQQILLSLIHHQNNESSLLEVDQNLLF